MIPSRKKLPVLYGEIINNVWSRQQEFMVSIPVPLFLRDYWRYNQLRVSTIYLNKDMVPPLQKTFDLIEKRGLAACIESFDGCFAIRKTRRSERQSTHSWGLAIDINAATNQLGAPPQISMELVSCFTQSGFVWGGDFSVPDGMHFQYVTET